MEAQIIEKIKKNTYLFSNDSKLNELRNKLRKLSNLSWSKAKNNNILVIPRKSWLDNQLVKYSQAVAIKKNPKLKNKNNLGRTKYFNQYKASFVINKFKVTIPKNYQNRLTNVPNDTTLVLINSDVKDNLNAENLNLALFSTNPLVHFKLPKLDETSTSRFDDFVKFVEKKQV